MKEDKLYLEHIQEALLKISEYILNTDKEGFLRNDMMKDAIVRKFEVIGEATKRVSEETKSKNPEIPWKYMAGMRDKLIHDYIDIDYWIVYKTAKEDVPELIEKFENLL